MMHKTEQVLPILDTFTSAVVLTSVSLMSNTITGLGGYYQYGVLMNYCTGTAANPSQMNNNTWTGNSSGYYFYGPRTGYSNYQEVKGNTVTNNSATYYMYGSYNYNYGGNNILIEDNIISDNAANYCYPMYNYSYNATNITINRNRITNNASAYYMYNYMAYYGDNVICNQQPYCG